MKFPEDLEALVHNMTVRRGSTAEYLSTACEAIDVANSGRPVPNGTNFVLTEHRDDKINATTGSPSNDTATRGTSST